MPAPGVTGAWPPRAGSVWGILERIALVEVVATVGERHVVVDADADADADADEIEIGIKPDQGEMEGDVREASPAAPRKTFTSADGALRAVTAGQALTLGSDMANAIGGGSNE